MVQRIFLHSNFYENYAFLLHTILQFFAVYFLLHQTEATKFILKP